MGHPVVPLDQISNIADSTENQRQPIKQAIQQIQKFNGIRSILTAVCFVTCLVIVLASLFSFCCGFLGYNKRTQPINRTRLSNKGGVCLLCGAGFSLFFSWLIMICVMISFTIGSHGEKYFCDNFMELEEEPGNQGETNSFYGLDLIEKIIQKKYDFNLESMIKMDSHLRRKRDVTNDHEHEELTSIGVSDFYFQSIC